jgi:hypothetical protein
MTVFVHTGLVKTGSTFLQECIFPNLDPIRYCPKASARERMRTILASAEIRDTAEFKNNFRFTVFNQFVGNLSQDSEATGRTSALFSNEKLSGLPGLNYENFTSNVTALKAHVPQAHVIFVIRRQDLFFQSLYGHAVAKGCALSPEEFLNLAAREEKFVQTEKKGWSARASLTNPTDYRCLQLDAMIEQYFAAFGRERVLILPHELLQVDPKQFIARLCAFMRCEFNSWHLMHSRRNVGPGGWALRYKLFANRLRASPALNHGMARRLAHRSVAGVIGASGGLLDLLRRAPPLPLSPEGQTRIREFYKASNDRLKKLLGDELEQFGY